MKEANESTEESGEMAMTDLEKFEQIIDEWFAEVEEEIGDD
jgi:hypothetical protein